jgi:hypothetical protein
MELKNATEYSHAREWIEDYIYGHDITDDTITEICEHLKSAPIMWDLLADCTSELFPFVLYGEMRNASAGNWPVMLSDLKEERDANVGRTIRKHWESKIEEYVNTTLEEIRNGD